MKHPEVHIQCSCKYELRAEVAPAPNTEQYEQVVAALWAMLTEHNQHRKECAKGKPTRAQVNWPWGGFTKLDFKGNMIDELI